MRGQVSPWSTWVSMCCIGPSFPTPALEISSLFMSLLRAFCSHPLSWNPGCSVLKVQRREERLHNLTFKPRRLSCYPCMSFLYSSLHFGKDGTVGVRKTFAPVFWGWNICYAEGPGFLEHYMSGQGEKPFLDLHHEARVLFWEAILRAVPPKV